MSLARGGTKRERPSKSPQTSLNKRPSVIDKPAWLLFRDESNADINSPAIQNVCDYFGDAGDVEDIDTSRLDNQEQFIKDDPLSYHGCLMKAIEPERKPPPFLCVLQSNSDIPSLTLLECSNDLRLPTHQVLPACAVYKVLQKFSHKVCSKCVFSFFKKLTNFLVNSR